MSIQGKAQSILYLECLGLESTFASRERMSINGSRGTGRMAVKRGIGNVDSNKNRQCVEIIKMTFGLYTRRGLRKRYGVAKKMTILREMQGSIGQGDDNDDGAGGEG
jgi:hypothetical protein